MMGKSLHPPMAKTHLKWLGISSETNRRYKAAVKRFFEYVEIRFLKKPSSLRGLRFAAGEFVNFVYQDDRPLDWAGNFLSGMKRLHPESKPALDTAQLYYNNWRKSVTRTKAFPYTLPMAMGMASTLVSEGQSRFAVVVLLAFAGVFRLGELMFLKLYQIDVVIDIFCLITLSNSKANGGPVSVIIRDQVVIKLLRGIVRKGRPDDRLLNVSYR